MHLLSLIAAFVASAAALPTPGLSSFPSLIKRTGEPMEDILPTPPPIVDPYPAAEMLLIEEVYALANTRARPAPITIMVPMEAQVALDNRNLPPVTPPPNARQVAIREWEERHAGQP